MTIMTRDFNSVDLSDPKAAALAVKRKALELGADVVGIGNIERWENSPLQMDPRQIMPECKSIIGLVFRVERGSLRGVEEGTFFSCVQNSLWRHYWENFFFDTCRFPKILNFII